MSGLDDPLPPDKLKSAKKDANKNKFDKKDVYRIHRAYTHALQTKIKPSAKLSAKLKTKTSPSISNHDNSENIMSARKDRNPPEWLELRPTGQEKQQKLSEVYDANAIPSTSDQLMDTQEDFINPKKTVKINQQNINPPTINVTNKYGVLQNANTENEQINIIPPKKKWTPPIIVNSPIVDYKKFIEDITNTLGHNRFAVKLNRNNTKVIVNSEEDHQKLTADLQATNMHYHTFTKDSEKTKKIVLKAAPGLDPQELTDTLTENNIQTQNITPLKGRNTNSFSYLITLPKNTIINNVRKIDNLNNLKVTWEKYSKKTDHTQCYKCQAFGHGQANCFNTPRCVKCPGKHYYKECPVQRTATSVAYCCNCGGPHTANFTKCPRLLEYLEARNRNNRSNQNNNQNFNQTPKQIPIRQVRQGQTYSSALRGSNDHPTEPLNALTNLLGDSTEISEIINLITSLTKLKLQ